MYTTKALEPTRRKREKKLKKDLERLYNSKIGGLSEMGSCLDEDLQFKR